LTVKTEQHEACGFAYTIVRSDGKAFGPRVFRGKNAVYWFLRHHLVQEEIDSKAFVNQDATCDDK